MLLDTSDPGPPRKPDGMPPPGTLLLGLAAGVATVGIWVALTARTGNTYHLAPVVATLAPAGVARLRDLRASMSGALVLVALGLAVTAVGWASIELVGVEPSATFVADQPGGVTGEVIGGALAGAALAAAMLRSSSRAR